ncbi:AMP-binding protein, partial [Collimonas pratensis]|uniref:non-ribosomal peptide synthetase n=1 Tax=Collimonas pratensis TaxID=279113 RepID=UPI00143D7DF5
LSVNDFGDSFSFTAQISNSVRAERVCEYMHIALEHLVQALEKAPDSALHMVEVLSPAECQQQLVDWNDTALDYPRELTIHQLFEAQVRGTPDHVALVFEERQMTYAELNAQANRLAHYLRERGVGPDVLVGICVERSLEMVVGLLAILKAGGAYVPLDPSYPQERLDYMLADAQPAALLTQSHLLLNLLTSGIATFCFDTQDDVLANYPASNPDNTTLPANLAYVIYTSGSTGKPKGIGIQHKNACAFIEWAIATFNKESLSKVLASTSVCFDLSVFEIFVPLSQGGSSWLVRNILDLSSRKFSFPITMINTVPSAMAEIHENGAIPSSVKVINLAGEALTTSLVQALYQRKSIEQIFNLYGPTEDTTYSTCALTVQGTHHNIPIGRPIANTQAYILDSYCNIVATGVAGELYLGGDGL